MSIHLGLPDGCDHTEKPSTHLFIKYHVISSGATKINNNFLSISERQFINLQTVRLEGTVHSKSESYRQEN